MPTRSPLLSLLSLAALPLLAGCASTPADPAGSRIVSFTVDGMACPNCAQHIEHELAAVPGVRSATVNFQTKTARVALDPDRPASTESLNAAVAAWRKEHFAAETDPECLDPQRRDEIKRGG